jgi:Holliday junction resolvase RusA-like endonuclease
MASQSVWIEGRLPGLNEIIALRASKYRGSYNREKRRWDRYLAELFRANLEPMARAHIHFSIVAPNKRMDPDNMLAGACKFVLDSLVHAGILSDDGWAEVASLTFEWSVDKQSPGIQLTLRSD